MFNFKTIVVLVMTMAGCADITLAASVFVTPRMRTSAANTTTNARCFGTKVEYDASCGKFTLEAACQKQVVCLWGDPNKDMCYPKDTTDPSAKTACEKITSEPDCDNQVGCEWRSNSDIAEWTNSVSAAVANLQVKSTPLPTGVSLPTPSYTSYHDHKAVSSGNLTAVLQAWKTKYGLPSDIVSGLGVLVAAESAEFKEWATAIHPTWNINKGEVGAFRNRNTGQYLSCQPGGVACIWETTLSQLFRRETGGSGQYRFKILQTDGTDTGMCLDREHCHSGSSNSRASDCNHCGAIHWQYDGNRLAEDSMKNCIQNDGSVNHCGSHATIDWPIVQFDGQVQVVAAGGRNYNGEVQVAFVYSTASSKIIAPSSISSSGINALVQNLQADVGPTVQGEATLLYAEMQRGSKVLV